MEKVRTPDERFQGLPGFDWTPRYLEGLDGFEDLRLHYLDGRVEVELTRPLTGEQSLERMRDDEQRLRANASVLTYLGNIEIRYRFAL